MEKKLKEKKIYVCVCVCVRVYMCVCVYFGSLCCTQKLTQHCKLTILRIKWKELRESPSHMLLPCAWSTLAPKKYVKDWRL